MPFNYYAADAHSDALMKLAENEPAEKMQTKPLPGLVQVYAVWTKSGAHRDILAGIDVYRRQPFCRCFTYADIMAALHSGRRPTLLSIENMAEEQVEVYRALGVKILGLVWNHTNPMAGGAQDAGGLTDLGRAAIRKAETCGMIPDLSHMNDESFYDALEAATKPVLLSHSNARAVCDHKRNITDGQFAALRKNGGVCGINFYPPFLGGNTLEYAVRHIEHFLALGGEGNICIGTDFDGIDKTPVDAPDSGGIYTLLNRLLQRNYKETLVNAIAFDNFMEIVKKSDVL